MTDFCRRCCGGLPRAVRCPAAYVLLGLLFPLSLQPIESGAASRTADHVALLRAVASRDPDEKVRNPDYLAKHFVRAYSRKEFTRNRFLLKGDFADVRSYVRRGLLGAYYYVNARTHHFDAVFSKALDQGIEQFVLLGAGHDTRAYRFRERLAGVAIFEVDVPGTQAHKKATLKRKLDSMGEHITFVPIDFNTQSLGEVLREAGYDSTAKTFFLWEGVTYYIEQQAVDATLRFVKENSGPGSTIILDYLLADALEQENAEQHSRAVRDRVQRWGEPFVFGIEAGEAGGFLAEHGFESISDLGAEELTKRYLMRSDGTADGSMVDHWRIVHAAVATDRGGAR